MHVFGCNPLKELKACKSPTHALLFSEGGQFLITGSNDECVRVWDTFKASVTTPVADRCTTQLLWQTPSLNSMPKDLSCFGDDKVAAFLLQTGEMVCLSAATGIVQWRKKLLGAVGYATLSRDSTKLLVNNLSTNNFDLYAFPENMFMRTFTIPEKTIRHKIKQGTFAGDNDEFVICGSLHGKSITATQVPQTRINGISIFASLLDTRTMIFVLALYVTYPSWFLRAYEWLEHRERVTNRKSARWKRHQSCREKVKEKNIF
ncbi:hypothetical protein PLEOSDRAFT_1081471 [Pleurotus ostreatus PC15]|uniref:Uncharacterized protein n=1 Tax=Pleurotus ostreatus (strain PC15) TaxID=1137138 RepID=A0A067P721_PLEO1|nr:hypothetical protein PLEOSDRAFT_1081471 [Pleurotus ostreatus PC15]